MSRTSTDSGDRSFFSSSRELVLWLVTGGLVLVIYSTLGLTGTLVTALPDRRLVDTVFVVGFVLAVVATAVVAVRVRLARVEIGLLVGVLGVFLMAAARLAIPEERTHLFEYAVVGVLVHEALCERRSNGGRVPAPVLVAIAATVAVGWLDELIQLVLPDRIYDLRDVGFNALAATLGVVGSAIVGRARRRAHDRAA